MSRYRSAPLVWISILCVIGGALVVGAVTVIAALSLPLLVGAALLGVGIGNRLHSRSPAA